jgi:hypothetical protein
MPNNHPCYGGIMAIKTNLIIIASCAMLFLMPDGFSQSNREIQPEPKYSFGFGFSDQVVTKYVPKIGSQLGDGFANQSMVHLSYAGFKLFGWGNWGIPETGFTGIVYGLQYKLKLPVKSERIKIDNMVAINKYIFPSYDLDNWVADYFISIIGQVQTTFQYSHVFSGGTVEHGDRIYGIVNYPVRYTFLSQTSIITPSISSTYNWDFYGKTGLAHLTFGLKNKLIIGRFSLNTFVNYQHSFESIKLFLESGFYGGLGFALVF